MSLVVNTFIILILILVSYFVIKLCEYKKKEVCNSIFAKGIAYLASGLVGITYIFPNAEGNIALGMFVAMLSCIQGIDMIFEYMESRTSKRGILEASKETHG